MSSIDKILGMEDKEIVEKAVGLAEEEKGSLLTQAETSYLLQLALVGRFLVDSNFLLDYARQSDDKDLERESARARNERLAMFSRSYTEARALRGGSEAYREACRQIARTFFIMGGEYGQII
jgi:hypothetical protein